MIGLLSEQVDIKRQLGKYFTVHDLYGTRHDFPKIEGLFIDWVDKNDMPDVFALQSAVIEKYVKTRIPVVIFDGNLSMTRKEFDWLKKFKVFFFEPAIKNRREFSYLPHWLSQPIKGIHKRNENRPYQLGYVTPNLDDRLKSFEMYYTSVATLYPDKKVCYQTLNINKDKEVAYTRDNIVRMDRLNLKDVSMTVLIDSQKNYEIGYIDPYLFYALHQGCLPLLPLEHKFFGNLFNKLVVSSASEVNFMIESFGGISYLIIDDIVDSINDMFPEMTIENVGNTIKEYLLR